MGPSKFMFSLSVMVALLAIFLTTDVCKPYREKLRRSVPSNVKEFIDRVTSKMTKTLNQVFGLPLTDSVTSTKTRSKKSSSTKKSASIIFTKNELQQYDGSDPEKPIYLAILGQVFDVSSGKRHYGKDGGYSFFTGKDGTRAFVTGKFDDEGLIDDIDGLSNSELNDLQDWAEFYKKDYKYVGVLVGNFYDENGDPTAQVKKVKKGILAAKREKKMADDDKARFPPCNSEWSQAAGSRVWCSDKSGGIERDWIGVPRIYKRPGGHATRCACVRTFGPPSDGSDPNGEEGDLHNPHLKLYEGCDPLLPTCKVKT